MKETAPDNAFTPEDAEGLKEAFALGMLFAEKSQLLHIFPFCRAFSSFFEKKLYFSVFCPFSLQMKEITAFLFSWIFVLFFFAFAS